MQSHVWRLEKLRARLQHDRLSATVDLTRPAEGLVEVSVGGSRLAGAHLLGVVVPSLPADDVASVIEHYARGTDLLGGYKESASRPLRVDALWRTVSPAPSEGLIAGVELMVSVRTELFDSRPELTVRTTLSATETLRLLDAGSTSYQPLAPSQDMPVAVQPEDGPGCVLFRLRDAPLSYAEMVHPADFQHDELLRSPEDDRRVNARHRLFAEHLEKGVILRARVRGVFLPRDDDRQIAAQCYRAFAAAEPPLGT